MSGNDKRRRPVGEGDLVQHMDNRQGRVVSVDEARRLPLARVRWFRGAEEVLPLGYIWVTTMEETE